MKFTYGKWDMSSMERGQENCYLLTNGLGGYSSLTMLGSCARNDHALFMTSAEAPTKRYHMISKIEERIHTESRDYRLSSQEYGDSAKKEEGYRYLNSFSQDIFPVWDFEAGGIEVSKTLVMKHGENTLGISYRLWNETEREAQLVCTPWLQFVQKGEKPREDQKFGTTEQTIISEGQTLYYATDGTSRIRETEWQEDYFYAQDARDGREFQGRAASTHEIMFTLPPGSERSFYIIYSTKPVNDSIGELFSDEILRQEKLQRQANIKDKIGQQLVRSSDCFLCQRDSTGEQTILAGYPFFGDWGRDTMIAVLGIGISTGRYKETKSIFRSFLQYCRRGLLPNMFPESGKEPLYNTVDASLLFIMAVYEYYRCTEDRAFIEEAWATLQEIIHWYEKGTDFHIHMEEDGLLRAGGEKEQVTWMDIRFGDILPTPRHGKPVEINAWWYNSLKMMGEFARLVGESGEKYEALADKVKRSFQQAFWNEETGCLRDVVSGKPCDDQIRCNQIWAVSAPFSVVDAGKERQITAKVFETLYTPYGLRTLSPEDGEFHPVYEGGQFERDMAYHQGTAWPFPLGAYYLAYLKVHNNSEAARQRVRGQLAPMEACLREGCAGQIPEVYDGLNPGCSKGCFAQAWSVGEMLRVYAALEGENK